MRTMADIIYAISGLDYKLMEKTQIRLDNLTKPQDSLGKLEELAKLIVGMTHNENPELGHKVIFTFAADHGVAEEKVSAFPKAVTAEMVYNFLRGGAAINVLAKHIGARVVIADLGVAINVGPHPKLIVKKVGLGTKNLAIGPAMSRIEAIKSIETGIEIFDNEYHKGINIVGTGEMGIANTTASSAITAVITQHDVEKLTGRGTGINDDAFKNKIKIIKDTIIINRPDANDPIDVLSKVGGFEIGGLAGVMLAAASKKVPIVIDGFISGAAALIAYQIEPKIKEYLIASHCSVEAGHKAILEYLGLEPLLNLNLRLGEGTGACLGISIVDAAIKILTQMATFTDAHVSEKIK